MPIINVGFSLFEVLMLGLDAGASMQRWLWVAGYLCPRCATISHYAFGLPDILAPVGGMAIGLVFANA